MKDETTLRTPRRKATIPPKPHRSGLTYAILYLIVLAWVAYSTLLGYMLWMSGQVVDAVMNPDVTQGMVQDATDMVALLVPASLALATVTLPIAAMLWNGPKQPKA